MINSNQRNILFKAMGSAKMGLGHINRCMALVRTLPQNWHATLMVNNEPSVKQFIEKNDFRVDTGLKMDVVFESQAEYFKPSVDLLIFDQLGKNKSLLKNLKKKFKCPVVAMDFFDYQSSDVDIIINLFNQASEAPPVAGRIEYHEGLQFSIISPQFQAYRSTRHPLKNIIQRALILMGGGDPEMKTCEALELFKSVSPCVKVDVVIGPLCPHEEAIRATAEQLSQTVKIYKNPKNLPQIMAKADVAISGCATTFFELSFLGVPAIVLSQNVYENRFCNFLKDQGVALYGKENLKGSWALISQLEQRQALVDAQIKKFDDRGASRILEVAGVLT